MMRKFVLSFAALSLAVPASFVLPAQKGEARKVQRTYQGRSARYSRGCRYSSGTTGLVAGGVGGAVVGRSVLGHGLLGTVAGAAGGALAGRAIDRSVTAKKRCR